MKTNRVHRFLPGLLLPLVLVLVTPSPAHTQAVGEVVIRVSSGEAPVEGAQVSSGGAVAITDSMGRAVLRLPVGAASIRVERIGYRTSAVQVRVPSTGAVEVTVTLEEEAILTEGILVMSTRTERRIEDEPLRVEVIGPEEVEEKLLMTPGDIAMLLNETAGLRVQSTAPSLGGASVRIQGLRGRYTQILSDGLPLYGGQTGALGPLQIPPMDLGQVEVIKGAASALYGASALGGVVNLIARRPVEGENVRELLLNQTTLNGTDAILWSSATFNQRWGYGLLASGHRQSRADVDDDGWADLPGFRRAVVRPRLFWNDGRGGTALVTLGGMVEERVGGTMPGRLTPGGTGFREALDTRRLDGGAVARFVLAGSRLLSVRGSGAVQWHDHGFGDVLEDDVHGTGFAEVSLSRASGEYTWVMGAAFQRDAYDARSLDQFDYVHTVPGVFAQSEYTVAEWLTVSASARLDHHSEYGTFLNPRLSLLLRPAQTWSLRASAGTGYFAPTPWTDETEAVGLSRLNRLGSLGAERARSASVDIARTLGSLEINVTAFGSVIDDAVQVRDATTGEGRIEFSNAEGEVRTGGTEFLARFQREGIHVSATHVFMRSTEPVPGGESRREVPLTPRHSVGLVAAWEQEGRGRVGAEFYYTGRQALEENPYRDTSEPHVIVGFLIERRFGPARVFLNAENILDTRQTRHDPLVLPNRAPSGRWATDVWAPLDGRAFNAGLRWRL